MKKLFAMLLALVMALTLVACGEQDGNDPQGGATGDKVIKIGVFEPQSGDNGAGGKQEILGMQICQQDVPHRHRGRRGVSGRAGVCRQRIVQR